MYSGKKRGEDHDDNSCDHSSHLLLRIRAVKSDCEHNGGFLKTGLRRTGYIYLTLILTTAIAGDV